MIRNSFLILPKVGLTKEKNIWSQGIKTWDSFLKVKDIKGISKKSKLYFNNLIRDSIKALHKFDSSFFIDKLPLFETWRLYNHFKDEAVFLDIEVSGVEQRSYITVIGLFDGINTKTMIRNINLDMDALALELKKYKLIITYNGNTFDLPFLKKRYPKLIPTIPCIDLKHLCKRIGLIGGLKKIEKQLGIIRQNDIVNRMSGGDPYLLWRLYLGSGDDHYLKLLIEYNENDVFNLKKIADIVSKELSSQLIGLSY